MELVFINALIDAGAGTESAFKLLKDGDISNANAAGYLGTLKGSWKLQKIHPEFLPKVYTVSAADLTIDPTGASVNTRFSVRSSDWPRTRTRSRPTSTSRSAGRQDGGARFKGTEYVQDFSYDCWAIDQLSEGIVPLFLPVERRDLRRRREPPSPTWRTRFSRPAPS